MDLWSLFLRPMPAMPMPLLLLQTPAPIIWLASATFVLRRYRIHGVWIVGTFPLAIFGWNLGAIAVLVLTCWNAIVC